MRLLLSRELLATWFLIGALLHAPWVSAQTATISVDALVAPVWPHVRVVKPADRDISLEAAAALASGSGAVEVDSPFRALGRGTQPYWALFSLQNPSASGEERLLVMEYTTQYDVKLFARDTAGTWQLVRSVADESRGQIGGGSIYPIWPVRLAPGAAREYLLRVEGPGLVRFPLFVYSSAGLVSMVRSFHVALGFAIGACLFIGIYILYLRRHVEDRSVNLFLAMLGGALLGSLWLCGYLSVLFPLAPERILSACGFAGFAVLYGCGSLHALEYLKMAEWSPWTGRMMKGLGWGWLAIAPWFASAFPVGARILLVWGGTGLALVMMLVAARAARRKEEVPGSGFIVAAWMSNLLLGAYFALARASDSPALWSPPGLALIQASAMSIFFGLAMTQRLVRQRLELETARVEAVRQGERVVALMHERSLLFAATSHDLRQPLMGVSIYADLLKSASGEQARADYARRLGLAISEVDGLLLGMQQLAAVHEGADPPVFEVVGLHEMLAPIVDEYRDRAASKRITIRYVPSRLVVATHPPYFQRIVRNALSNAIRYTPAGKTVLIGSRRGGRPHVLVADTGRGMSEDQRARAFEAFQRFDALNQAPDGAGLGLYSARALGKALGLEVRLDSKPGRGSQFRVFVPGAH